MTTANFLDISDILIIQVISDRNECAISFIVSFPSQSPYPSKRIKREFHFCNEITQVTRDVNELSFNRNNIIELYTYILICQL